MLTLGSLTLMEPLVLLATAVLPLVWLLLRLTPPALRRIDFPAARLLFGLAPTQRTTARTPPWLVVLRIGLLALAILGLADPVLTVQGGGDGGPVVIVLDNGWGAANGWEARIAALKAALERADHHQQRVALITTAPQPLVGGGATEASQFTTARAVLTQVRELAPQAWPADRGAAAKKLRALHNSAGASAIWISDGVATAGDSAFADALAGIGPVTILEQRNDPPLVLPPPQRTEDSNAIAFTVHRIVAGDAGPGAAVVRALDLQGQVLGRTTLAFADSTRTATGTLALPPELANRITRFDVENHPGAAATALVDGHWQRRPVGIASAGGTGIEAPLLEDAFYIRQALAPYADVHTGNLDELLAQPLAVMVMAGGGRILDNELPRVTTWVENGGVLVRFAGLHLESNVDPLLPVRLRAGGRSFGGALSWSEPVGLAPFPANSPFRDLSIPSDVTVSTQVLAEPTPELPSKTWASLTDGTPLVTAERRGQGWIVLVHVTATPEWSSLPLSGLFVDMLRRTVDLSAGVAAISDKPAAETLLPPLQIMDGLGRLAPAGPAAAPIATKNLTDVTPGPETPPGLYGKPGDTVALNLSAHLDDAAPLRAKPDGAHTADLNGIAPERALKPWLLTVALLLLLIDLAVSFLLRGLAPDKGWRHRATSTAALVAVAAILAVAKPARADTKAPPIDPAIAAAILDNRLAYVVTGSGDIDRVEEAGLRALTQVLADRTSVELAAPAAVDLTAANLSPDSLIPYPVLYWRISPAQALPTAKAAAALSAYIHRGGMVIFDAPEEAALPRDRGSSERLAEILRDIDAPPLMTMSDDHVLTRSFYLLPNGLPGRFADAPVYVEKGSSANDGVSSLVVSGNDWAAAWARDAGGLPLFPVVPEGERQREMAYRAGVNMVMYALTGNYKADQVHLDQIMRRLTQ